MAVNVVKHIRKLVSKRDRIQKYIQRRQKELDAVVTELERVQAAIGGGRTKSQTAQDPDASEGRLEARDVAADASGLFVDFAAVKRYLCGYCGVTWQGAREDHACPKAPGECEAREVAS